MKGEGPLIVNGKSLIVKGEGGEGPAFASYGAAAFAGAKTEKSLIVKGSGSERKAGAGF